MKKCCNCEYYVKDLKAGVNNGICKLYPPVPILMPSIAGINITMIYPAVNNNDHCGQYEQSINKTFSVERYPEA